MKKWAILVNERKPTTKPTPLTAQSLTGTLVLHQGQFLWQADFRRDPAAPPPPARQPSQRSQPLRRSTSLPTCDHDRQFKKIDKRFNRLEKFLKMLGRKFGCSKAELDILDTRRPRVREEEPSQAAPETESEGVEAEDAFDVADTAAGEEDDNDVFDISVFAASEDEDDGDDDDEDDDDDDEDDDDDDEDDETESG